MRLNLTISKEEPLYQGFIIIHITLLYGAIIRCTQTPIIIYFSYRRLTNKYKIINEK
jgi:hypothetical protein